ncbi:MAG TPA: alpha/beta hydrolase [Candidatus Binataceae bacterium]|nr:alpha/beta hydrolase [Candidatus Binataceae bacterium]
MAIEKFPDDPVSGYLRVNGANLQYLDWGGDGPPILILHATGFLGRLYRPIAQALRPLGRVYSYDQLGHGGSDAPALEEISWYRTADDLEAFLEQMRLRGVRAFGHSAGATAIAAIADRRPDLIARAILVEPVIVDKSDPRERPSELYERTLKRKPAFDSLAAMYANFASKPGYSAWRADILHDYCEYGTRSDAGGRRLLRCTPEVEARLYQTARDFDGLQHILADKIPALLVFGEKSDSPGIGFAERIAQSASHRRIVVIPGGGHLLPMEQPEEIARLAVEFFSAA